MKEIFWTPGGKIIEVSYGEPQIVVHWGSARPQVEATLTCEGAKYTTPFTGSAFSTGFGITPRDILSAVVSDAQSFLNCQDEADFLVSFGYNESVENLRKGKKAFLACAQAAIFFEGVGITEDDLFELYEMLEG